jgi:N-acyl homoserine lactone hydrolase
MLRSLLFLCLISCAASSHSVQPAKLGRVARTSELLALLEQPGPIAVETVEAADWAVPLSGLLNLDHERAEAAGLEDRDEPIVIFFHAVRHPTQGLFMIDTGVERALRDDPDNAAIRGIVASAANIDQLKVKTDTAGWLREHGPLAGVFLTHLHVDHISGMPDVPKGTPFYAGPGEPTPRNLDNLLLSGTIDRQLEGHAPISEWGYAADPDGAFDGVIDIFGDGSLWALSVPGHTPGSTAYLARTAEGPVLMVGDACHTRWGWEHDVEPGEFSHDQPRSALSLAKLRAFAAAHPSVKVKLGHQL